MPFTQEDIDALRVALGITAPAAPVASAPAAPVVASPFAGTASGAASTVATTARKAFPGDLAAQRASIAVSLAPRFTCTVDTTATYPDGTTVPSALHGFTTAHTTGDPCPGVKGLGKGEPCPGTIR